MGQKVKKNLIHKSKYIIHQYPTYFIFLFLVKFKEKEKTDNTHLKKMNSNFQNLFRLEQAQLHQDHWQRLKSSEEVLTFYY